MSRTYYDFSIIIHHEKFKIDATTFAEFSRKNKKCRRCLGTKRIYVDPPDPVEGHKLSRIGPCDLCEGSGDESLDDLKEQYESHEAKWSSRRDRAVNRFLLIERMFSTFDDEELEILGVTKPNQLRKIIEETQL